MPINELWEIKISCSHHMKIKLSLHCSIVVVSLCRKTHETQDPYSFFFKYAA